MWLQQLKQNSNKKSAHIFCNTPFISPLPRKTEIIFKKSLIKVCILIETQRSQDTTNTRNSCSSLLQFYQKANTEM